MEQEVNESHSGKNSCDVYGDVLIISTFEIAGTNLGLKTKIRKID